MARKKSKKHLLSASAALHSEANDKQNNKTDLLGDSEEEEEAEGRRQTNKQNNSDLTITINKKYAQKYEERKKRELLAKHKEELEELSGKNPLNPKP